MRRAILHGLALLLALTLGGACARATFAPAPHAARLALPGLHGQLTTTQKVLGIAATREALPPENRKHLAPGFTPGIFLTAALEAELQAAHVPTAPQDKGLYLAATLHWFSPHKIVFDAGLYAEHGEPLFVKRAYCAAHNSTRPFDGILVEALRQILADPKFAQALHSGAKP